MSSNQGFNPPRVVRGHGNARRARSNHPSQQASSSMPTTSRSPHLWWSSAIDTVLRNVLLEAFISRGRPPLSSFRGVVLNAAVAAVTAQVIDINQWVARSNVKSRIVTLKKEYKLAKDAIECIGFNIVWDDENKYITADFDVWLSYIEAHPRSAHLQHKIFP